MTPEPIVIGATKDRWEEILEALESGLEYSRDCLATHDSTLGRTIRRNRVAAERLEQDIAQIIEQMEYVKNCVL